MALSDGHEHSAAVLKCRVARVYPKPEVTIYRLNKGRKELVPDVKRFENYSNHGHNVELSAQVIDDGRGARSSDPMTYECVVDLDINGDRVTKSSRVTYVSPLTSSATTLSSHVVLAMIVLRHIAQMI